MNKKIIGVMAIAMLLAGALIAPASAHHHSNLHCPGGSGHADPVPSGYTVVKHDSGAADNGVEPAAGTKLCVKSGNSETGMFHTGVIEADGEKTLQEYLFAAGIVDGSGDQGRDVSYYIIYTPGQPEVCSDLYPDADHPDLPLEELDDPAVDCFEEPEAVCPDGSNAQEPGTPVPSDTDVQEFCFEEDSEVEISVDGAMICLIDPDDEGDLGDLSLSYWIDTESTEDVSLSVDGADLGVVPLTGVFAWPLDGQEIAESVELVATVEGESDTATVLADGDEIDLCTTVDDTPPLEQPQVEPGDEPTEVDSVKVEKKTEVLAETATLPETGVPALVLALLGLVAMGSGGALLRRRR